jgi:hypothetical protein
MDYIDARLGNWNICISEIAFYQVKNYLIQKYQVTVRLHFNAYGWLELETICIEDYEK